MFPLVMKAIARSNRVAFWNSRGFTLCASASTSWTSVQINASFWLFHGQQWSCGLLMGMEEKCGRRDYRGCEGRICKPTTLRDYDSTLLRGMLVSRRCGDRTAVLV